MGAQRLAGRARLTACSPSRSCSALAIGLAVGTLGGGGSVLAVPVLVYVLGEDLPDATTRRCSWSAPARWPAPRATRSPGASAGATPSRSPSRRCPGSRSARSSAMPSPDAVLLVAFGARDARRRALDLAPGGARRARTGPRRRRLPAAAASARRARGDRGRLRHRLPRRRRRLPDRPDARRRPRLHDAHRGRHLAGDHHRHLRAQPRRPPRRGPRRRGPRRRRGDGARVHGGRGRRRRHGRASPAARARPRVRRARRGRRRLARGVGARARRA